MVWQKLKIIFSILIDLFISLCDIPFLIFQTNKIISISLKFKSPQRHEFDITQIATTLRSITIHNPSVQIVIDRKPGEGHSSRSSAYKNGKYKINISSLTSIIEINQHKKYADVEALVTFEEVCKATIKYGLLPAVVPEFKSITIGGAIQGIGIESTSWKYGTFDKTVIEATLITGHGNIVYASKVPHLWKGIPGSNGTLALVVAARIRLVQATEWIHLRYIFYPNLANFLNDIEKKICIQTDTGWIGDNQVIDAIDFCRRNQSMNGIVAMYGGCVPILPPNAIIYKETMFSSFFYQHVKNILTMKKMTTDHNETILYEEYMPTLEYLFRYDRGGFWGIEALAKMIPLLGFIFQTPFLLGIFNHFLKTKTLYKIAMLISDQKRESMGMLQDVDVPPDHAQEIINWAINKDLNMLWLCPVLSLGIDESLFSVVQSNTHFVMNIGLYGIAKDLPQSNLDLQRLVAKLGGKCGLYAHIYLDREEFWSCYNYKEYIRLREMSGGYVFMDLWDKVAGIVFSKISIKR
ncbi:unnamed protein product [Adineta steineri]|uniref:Delta(24)-sterol reductase n=2 Tax=Adineta steineri TaxID=433720 RepID=A0A819LU64_9BILA|nr:unnamed protein product [Adineta steineri]CAF3758845.1 unnamed protein product [Adineta steineri]CAF3967207.1 unnamed protein product [Adineta steineri]